VHYTSTNTWRLDLSIWADFPAETFGLRVGSAWALRARFPNALLDVGGGPEGLDLSYSLDWLKVFMRTHAPENETIYYFSYPSDWPGVYWLDEPEGGPLPVAGVNVGGTGRWYDSYGGHCSGRQAPFGFWCSWANPRSNLPQDPQTPYGIPGGFTFSGGVGDASRPSRWKNASGAVYHINSGFLSMQCLVNKVDGGTVHFDHSIGCDQAGPQPPTEGWYAENVFEECDSPQASTS